MPEEFIKFALAKSFRAYGISSHGPLPFETFWNMSAFDMPEYLVEISRLKDKYQGHLEVYTGMEIDYLDTTYNPSIPYFQSLPLDYRIGSVHFLPIATELCEANMVCIDGPFSEFKQAVDTYFEGDIRKMVKRYYESSIRMVGSRQGLAVHKVLFFVAHSFLPKLIFPRIARPSTAKTFSFGGCGALHSASRRA